jgi:hypothetical protein
MDKEKNLMFRVKLRKCVVALCKAALCVFAAATISLLIKAKGDNEPEAPAVGIVIAVLLGLKFTDRQAIMSAIISGLVFIGCYSYLAARNGHL